jgi:hypothetical protein
VIGPADASISVDGRVVGRGSWHTESIAAGVHHVIAAIEAAPDCPTAEERKDVRVATRGTTTARLTPRGCGTVTLDIEPAGASYSLASSGSAPDSGTAPAPAPVQLPEGTYALHVSAKYCADYSGTVTIASGNASYQRVRLICQ